MVDGRGIAVNWFGEKGRDQRSEISNQKRRQQMGAGRDFG